MSPTAQRKKIQAVAAAKDNPAATIKMIIIGEAGVGKSQLFHRFKDRVFHPNLGSTVGVDFGLVHFTTPAGLVYKLQMWDCCGADRFRSVTRSYYRGAAAIMLVFDITNRSSFEMLRGWLKEIAECAPENVVVSLIGNKTDLLKSGQQQAVTKEELIKFVMEFSLSHFDLTSAKNDDNVESALQRTIEKVYDLSLQDPAMDDLIHPGRKGKSTVRGEGGTGGLATVQLSSAPPAQDLKGQPCCM